MHDSAGGILASDVTQFHNGLRLLRVITTGCAYDILHTATLTFSKPHAVSGTVFAQWLKTAGMKLSDDLIKKLSKKYEPAALMHDAFRGNDIAFKTDGDGNPVQLFIGKRAADGTIKGERFARTLKHDKDGRVIKDHWEKKGKAT